MVELVFRKTEQIRTYLELFEKVILCKFNVFAVDKWICLSILDWILRIPEEILYTVFFLQTLAGF